MRYPTTTSLYQVSPIPFDNVHPLNIPLLQDRAKMFARIMMHVLFLHC